jgi:uroporphyrinogen-III decarboxylase
MLFQDGIRIDEIVFFEDMCGTNAPIIGPHMFNEFLAPGYHRLIKNLRDFGVSLFTIDTDGNAWDLIPAMVDAGLNGLHPCEVNAGMDAHALRNTFTNLVLSGGIAKKALTKGYDEIKSELLCKFAAAWQKGRFLPRLDHLAPPDISLENIRTYADLYLQYANSPGCFL